MSGKVFGFFPPLGLRQFVTVSVSRPRGGFRFSVFCAGLSLLSTRDPGVWKLNLAVLSDKSPRHCLSSLLLSFARLVLSGLEMHGEVPPLLLLLNPQ